MKRITIYRILIIILLGLTSAFILGGVEGLQDMYLVGTTSGICNLPSGEADFYSILSVIKFFTISCSAAAIVHLFLNILTDE